MPLWFKSNREVDNDEDCMNNEIKVRATDTCEEIKDFEDDEILDSIPHHIFSIEDDYIEDDYIESDNDRDNECGDNTDTDKEEEHDEFIYKGC
uniref:Uncharacterized protein n=1 Tax=Amphimedon queenslandica TaxID=400682 RepID=A0A1X7VIH3_AMPQE